MTKINTEFTGEIQHILAQVVDYVEGEGILNIAHMRRRLASTGWVNTPDETPTEDCVEMIHSTGLMCAVRMWIQVCPYAGGHKIVVGLDEVTADRPDGHGFAVLFQGVTEVSIRLCMM